MARSGVGEARVALGDRQGRPVDVGYCRLRVEEMTWVDPGGPEQAVIHAEGGLAGLGSLVTFLRYSVRLSDPVSGAACWWGYVSGVEIHHAGAVYQATLNGMCNRAAARYRDEDPLGGGPGAWTHQTDWQNDLASQAQYGVIEQVFNLGESREDQALAAAQAHLARLRQPQSSSRWEEPGETYARLICQGWWSTLDWQFYREERGYTGNLERSAGGHDCSFGHTGGQSQVEQALTITGNGPWQASQLWLKLYRVGAPADNLICELLSAPSSGVLASQSVAGSTLSCETASWTVIDLEPVLLSNGATCYLRLRRSGGVDANNHYGLKVEEDALLSNLAFWNGSSWMGRTPPASWIMALYGQEDAARQIVNIGAAAQFISGVRVSRSGQPARLYRNGRYRMREELEMLAAGEGMRIWVNEARQLIAEPQPETSQVERLVSVGGEVRHISGRRLVGGESPVGNWAAVEGLAPMAGSAGAPSAVWLERAVWRDGRIKVLA